MSTESAVLLPAPDLTLSKPQEPLIINESPFSNDITPVTLIEPSSQNLANDKTMLLKFNYLNRLGMGSKLTSSMTKADFMKMSVMFEAERKESLDEGDGLEDLMIQKSYSNSEGDFSLNLFQRTDDEVRQAYLNRLINMGILKLQPSKKHQEIIILDWDDTLMCTSYLTRIGLMQLPEGALEPLRTLDEKVAKFLEKATSFGQVIIITNAEEKWVAYTGLGYLPKSYEIIQEKIQVISARARYQEEFPADTFRWKVETFLDLRKNFNDNVIANIVSIGDSRAEMEAARCLGEQMSHSIVKTVKFKNNPGVNDLIKQLNLLNDKFEQIITSRASLTIRLEKKSSS